MDTLNNLIACYNQGDMADDKKGQDTVQKLLRFTPELADKIEAYQKSLGLRSFQNAVEVICAQYLAEKEKRDEKPS